MLAWQQAASDRTPQAHPPGAGIAFLITFFFSSSSGSLGRSSKRSVRDDLSRPCQGESAGRRFPSAPPQPSPSRSPCNQTLRRVWCSSGAAGTSIETWSRCPWATGTLFSASLARKHSRAPRLETRRGALKKNWFHYGNFLDATECRWTRWARGPLCEKSRENKKKNIARPKWRWAHSREEGTMQGRHVT